MTKSKSAPAASPALSLPPYGHMAPLFTRSMELTPVPEGFRVGGRLGDAADYTRFINDTADKIAEVLWPRYDFARRTWYGDAAVNAEALTAADFSLMRTLRGRLSEEVVVPGLLRDTIAVRKEQRLGKNQHALFLLEDTSARGTIDLYLKDIKESAPDLLEKMKLSVSAGFARLGPTTLRLKQELQRPRPYQVAFIYGEGFNYEYGATAVTPSLISGHCMQGLFVRGYATLMNRNALQEHLGALAAMQRYCIEIGDRRVYAGVHYPSDNLSSWYGCLRLCHHSFDAIGQEAKDFMWEAIQGSDVYLEMLKASTTTHKLYAPLLKWLETEALRKV